MSEPRERSGQGAVRSDGRVRRASAALFAVLVVVLTAAGIAGAALSVAAPARAATAAPSPPASALPVDPTIDAVGTVTSATATFTGTGTPGDGIRVAVPSTPTASICRTSVDDSGRWGCSGAVTSGPDQEFTAFDTTVAALHEADAPAVDVLVPPTITTSAPTTGGVTGTGYPGATVTLVVLGTGVSRSAVVAADGTWFVSWSSGTDALGTGTVSMQAQQTADTTLGFAGTVTSDASTASTIVIDRTAPDAPVITTPASGASLTAQPLTFGGTGETGATVTVYIDGNPVCQTTVTDGTWSCSTAGESIPDGARAVSAGQHDPAGNFSPATTPFTVTVAGAPVGSPPSDQSGSSPSSTPSTTPDPTDTATPGTTSPFPRGTTGSGGSDPTGGGASGTTGSTTGDHPDASRGNGWAVATTFDRAVPTIGSVFSFRTLAVVLVGVVGFLALVAVPMQLAARSTGGAGFLAWSGAGSPWAAVQRRLPLRLTGRNRTSGERIAGDVAVPTWAIVAGAVLLVMVLALLGTGIEAQQRYLRLAIAVAAGAAVLALGGVVLPSRWAAGVDRGSVRFRISPVLVLVALVACVVTRTADLSPTLLVGVVLSARPGQTTEPERQAFGRDASWRFGGLLVATALGWVLHSAVASGHGFWAQLLGEFAVTLCVGGISSAVVALVPVVGSPGAALLAVSPVRYAGVATLGVGFAVAVYSGADGTHFPVAAIIAAVVAFAVVGLVTWTWVRVVEPALHP